MLALMSKQLSEIIPPHPKEILVRVCCRGCGARLGDYPFSGDLVIDDHGKQFTVRPAPRRVARPGRKISPQGAARFTQEMSPDGRYTKLKWNCGCGAMPDRHSNRWGRLEVSEGKLPTIWI